jgi:hypothetical protein
MPTDCTEDTEEEARFRVFCVFRRLIGFGSIVVRIPSRGEEAADQVVQLGGLQEK